MSDEKSSNPENDIEEDVKYLNPCIYICFILFASSFFFYGFIIQDPPIYLLIFAAIFGVGHFIIDYLGYEIDVSKI